MRSLNLFYLLITISLSACLISCDDRYEKIDISVKMIPERKIHTYYDVSEGAQVKENTKYFYDNQYRFARIDITAYKTKGTATETVQTIIDLEYNSNGQVGKKTVATTFNDFYGNPQTSTTYYEYSYSGNTVTETQETLSSSTIQTDPAGRIISYIPTGNMYSFSYTYSETGNLASFSHTSGATVVNYTYGHDAKHGIFEYVRMPKWFTSLFLDGGLHLANNVNSEAVESGSRSTYSYEYNQHGYPAVVNITPPKDSGNETVSRTVVSYFDITE